MSIFWVLWSGLKQLTKAFKEILDIPKHQKKFRTEISHENSEIRDSNHVNNKYNTTT